MLYFDHISVYTNMVVMLILILEDINKTGKNNILISESQKRWVGKINYAGWFQIK